MGLSIVQGISSQDIITVGLVQSRHFCPLISDRTCCSSAARGAGMSVLWFVLVPRNHTVMPAAWLPSSYLTEHPVLHKMGERGRSHVGARRSQNGHFVTTEAIMVNLQTILLPPHTFSYPQGLFHPARKVREVYWKIYNMLYIGSQVRSPQF